MHTILTGDTIFVNAVDYGFAVQDTDKHVSLKKDKYGDHFNIIDHYLVFTLTRPCGYEPVYYDIVWDGKYFYDEHEHLNVNMVLTYFTESKKKNRCSTALAYDLSPLFTRDKPVLIVNIIGFDERLKLRLPPNKL